MWIAACKETGTTRVGFPTKAGSMILNKDNASRGRDLHTQKIASEPVESFMALVGIGGDRRELLFTSNCVEVTSGPLPQEGLTSQPGPPSSKTTIAGAEGC